MQALSPKPKDPLSRILPELEFRALRSSGPGGQNVNKVSTKMELRWAVSETRAIHPEALERLFKLAENRINKEGSLVITSDRFRDQPRNREDCLEKLRELIVLAGKAPKKRKKTKVPRAKIERRLENKRRRSTRLSERRF